MTNSTGAIFSDVSFAYPGSDSSVLRHLDWRVEDGAFVVVAGESGAGKSSLLRCLNGLVPHFSGGRFGGSVTVHGIDTRAGGPQTLSSTVGFVFQDPDAQCVAAIVEDELAFGMEQLGVPRLTMRKRVEEVLDLLGIAELRAREMETLSGGERQRVAIAAALTMQPRMLVLDEPTSQLDPWGAERVITALERLNQDLGLTVVVSEHRLERVLAPADRLTAIARSGQLIEGTPHDVLRQLDTEMLPPVARLGRMLEWVPAPLTIKEGRRALLASRAPVPIVAADQPAAVSGNPIVSVSELTLTHGQRVVVRDLTFEIRPGEVVALMGRNGSGKTTLLRAMMGFHKPLRGRVALNGVEFDDVDSTRSAGRIGYLPQRPGAILFNDTVRAELAFTLRCSAPGGRDPEAILAELQLLDVVDQHPRALSVGEQERTALAAVLVADPRLLLLDEPTRGMDYQRKRALSATIARRRLEGVATVLATHDVEMVAETATRVILLGDGEIVADGSPREVLSGSLGYSTQMNKLIGGGFLTVDEVVAAYRMQTG